MRYLFQGDSITDCGRGDYGNPYATGCGYPRLLEADLMDEEGAMGVVWDCMAMGNVHANSYAKAYYHIMENSNKEEPNPMVTEKAKAYWDEKKRIVARFAELLADDLMIGSPYFDI